MVGSPVDREEYTRNRVDYQLANLLNGEHPLENSLEVKVIQLVELEILYGATTAAGWARHTGDWDWAVFVSTVDGELPGEGYNVTIKRPNGVPLEDFTACVDYGKITHVEIDGYHVWSDEADDWSEEEQLVLPIEAVTGVRWEQR